MTPSDEQLYKLGLSIITSSILDSASTLLPQQISELKSLTFPPCGKPNCLCHEISSDVRDLLLKSYAYTTLNRPLHSPTPPTTQGLPTKTPPQNPELN